MNSRIFKVIDTCGMRSSALGDFLSRSKGNTAVLVEPVLQEIFSGSDRKIRQSLEIVTSFPDQVIMLRSNYKIVRLRPRLNGLRDRLTSQRVTKEFREFIPFLLSGCHGMEMNAHFKALRQTSVHENDVLIQSAEHIKTGVRALFDEFSSAERKLWRERPMSDDALLDKVFIFAMREAKAFLKETLGKESPEHPAVAVHSLQFRFSLCGIVLAMDQISTGGFENKSLPKVRNDWTDMLIAAYGTFFDGVISEDRNLVKVFNASRKFLAIIHDKIT